MATGPVTPATVPVAIPPGTKLVHLQYDAEKREWILWVHHDRQLQHGTQLRLEPNGGLRREVHKLDGSVDEFRVMEGSK